MISLIAWLIVGGLIGWIASMIMKTDAQQGVFLNIIVGIVGSFLANLVANRGLVMGNALEPMSILWSLVGSIVLLGIVNLFRRGRVR